MLYSRAFHCALLHRVLALHCSSDPVSCLNMFLILSIRDITERMNGLWREAQSAAWRAKKSPASTAHSRKIYRAGLAHTYSYLKEETVASPNAQPKVHKPNAMHPLAKLSAFAAVSSRQKKKDCFYSSKVFLTLISKRILRSPNTINDQVWSNMISVLGIGCLKRQILVLRTVWNSDYAAVLTLVVLFLYTWYIYPVYVHKLYCIMFLKSRCWGSVGNMLPHPLPEHTEPSGIRVMVLSHVTVSCVHWEQTYCGNDINTAERLTKYYLRQTLLQNP